MRACLRSERSMDDVKMRSRSEKTGRLTAVARAMANWPSCGREAL